MYIHVLGYEVSHFSVKCFALILRTQHFSFYIFFFLIVVYIAIVQIIILNIFNYKKIYVTNKLIVINSYSLCWVGSTDIFGMFAC